MLSQPTSGNGTGNGKNKRNNKNAESMNISSKSISCERWVPESMHIYEMCIEKDTSSAKSESSIHGAPRM
jgi:hypothetical protein